MGLLNTVTRELAFADLTTFDQLTDEVNRLLEAEIITEAEAWGRFEQASVPRYDELTEQERWSHFTVQLPGDWGPEPQHRLDMRERLTQRASGLVVEAMCGFTSYIDDSEDIEEVVAVDYCREGLERYNRPERRRLLFDLDKVRKVGDIAFIEDQEVGTICITFGVNYIGNPGALYREFARILQPGGNVLLINGTACGYQDLVKRSFQPCIEKVHLEEAGFEVDLTRLPYDSKYQSSDYYLIEATTPD
jgi:SAM-dependent methyltransferase